VLSGAILLGLLVACESDGRVADDSLPMGGGALGSGATSGAPGGATGEGASVGTDTGGSSGGGGPATGSATGGSATDVPIDLCAGLINDKEAHPMVSAALPAVGAAFVDPAFGTTIRRLSDTGTNGVMKP